VCVCVCVCVCVFRGVRLAVQKVMVAPGRIAVVNQ
jgi:hypothetical protein